MSNAIVAFLKQNIGERIAEKSPSKVSQLLDGVLLKVEEGTIEVSYQVTAQMTNPAGLLHGGIAATMLDDVMGMAVFSMGNNVFYSTVNLSIDYLYSAKVGETLSVEAKIIRMGKKIAHVEGTIRNEQQQLVAKCTSNLVATSHKIE